MSLLIMKNKWGVISVQILKAFFRFLTKRGSNISFSQNGEDAVIFALLRNIENGVYFDVGAYHPFLYSNTYALYRKGWKGVVVDPNKMMNILYKIFRNRDTFVNLGVGSKKISQTYFMFSDGAYNTFDEAVSIERKKMKRLSFLGSTTVRISPLSEIIKNNKLSRVDFLNIDVEGMDMEVLQSHDWVIRPRVIAIEDHSFNPSNPTQSEIYNFMILNKYKLSGFTAYTLIFLSDY